MLSTSCFNGHLVHDNGGRDIAAFDVTCAGRDGSVIDFRVRGIKLSSGWLVMNVSVAVISVGRDDMM